MSRPRIFAEHITDPTTAAALREHRQERTALLATLTRSLTEDPTIRAVWLWGSLGRGDADDLSDLDLWVITDNASAANAGTSLREHVARAGHALVSAGEAPQNAPPGGGYLGTLLAGRHGLLHVDWYWQPQSAVQVVPIDIVLNRTVPPLPAGKWQAVTGGQPARPSTGERDRIEDGIAFLWLMLSIVAKWLARDPESDMGLMLYPRPGFEEAIVLLGQQDSLGPVDWSVPDRPGDKVQRLRELARKAEQLTDAANAQGCALSPLYAPALDHYLDLVAGIVADRS